MKKGDLVRLNDRYEKRAGIITEVIFGPRRDDGNVWIAVLLAGETKPLRYRPNQLRLANEKR